MPNFFDQFDAPQQQQSANFFDQFDARPTTQEPSVTDRLIANPVIGAPVQTLIQGGQALIQNAANLPSPFGAIDPAMAENKQRIAADVNQGISAQNQAYQASKQRVAQASTDPRLSLALAGTGENMGNLLNPMGMVGSNIANPVLRGMAGASGFAASQPVLDPQANFWLEKAKQQAIALPVGAITGALTAPPKTKAPTLDELKDIKTAQYKAVEDVPVPVTPEMQSAISDRHGRSAVMKAIKDAEIRQDYALADEMRGLLKRYSKISQDAQGRPQYLRSSESLATPPAPSIGDMERASRIESVPLSSARGTQSKMEFDRFTRGEHPPPLISGYDDKPVAVRKENGEFLIFDGHHRVATAIASGQKHLEMHVIDAKNYAPEFAGRAPAASISDDELLSQLGVQAGDYGDVVSAKAADKISRAFRELGSAAYSTPGQKTAGAGWLGRREKVETALSDVPDLTTARRVNTQIEKATRVEEAIRLAQDRNTTPGGTADLNQALRREFGKLVGDRDFMKSLTQPEQDAIKQVANGTFAANTLQRLGKFSPIKNALSAWADIGIMGGGLHLSGGDFIGAAPAMALAGIGEGARQGGIAVTSRNAALASELIRRGALPQTPQPAFPGPTPNVPVGNLPTALLIDALMKPQRAY